jgi:hypothetical protein
VQNSFFPVVTEFVPVEIVLPRILFGVADDVTLALAEEIDGILGYFEQDDGLLVVVVAGDGSERPQAVRELRLEVGAIFKDAVAGEGSGVEGTDPAIPGGDQIRHEIVEMVMGVAGDRGLDEIRGAVLAILDGEGWPRGVVNEGYPADFTGVGAFLPAMAFAGPAKVARGVAQGLVVGGDDSVADGRFFGFGRREFRREGNGFMRRKDEIEPADVALLS